MSNQEEPTNPREYWEDEDKIMECRIALRRDYISQGNALSVRLLGLIAALFTLIEAVQQSATINIHTIFSSLALANLTYTESELYAIDFFKLLIIFGITFVLFFLIFRTFFKFTLNCAFASHLKFTGRIEIGYLLKIKGEAFRGRNIMLLLDRAARYKISGHFKEMDEKYQRLKILNFWPPYDYFMSDNSTSGNIVCFVLSVIATIVLVGLIW